LRDAVSKHGLIDGKNIRVDMRLAEGKLDRLPELAETVVREGATVILAFGEAAGRAAAATTKAVPIVCVADDLVDATPGSNVTGVSILATELDAKRIEL
jgi:putative ABC transport system substrate-binding protein